MSKDLYKLGSELDSLKVSIEELRKDSIAEVFNNSMSILQEQLQLSDEQMIIGKDVIYHTLVRAIEGINQDFNKHLR